MTLAFLQRDACAAICLPLRVCSHVMVQVQGSLTGYGKIGSASDLWLNL